MEKPGRTADGVVMPRRKPHRQTAQPEANVNANFHKSVVQPNLCARLTRETGAESNQWI